MVGYPAKNDERFAQGGWKGENRDCRQWIPASAGMMGEQFQFIERTRRRTGRSSNSSIVLFFVQGALKLEPSAIGLGGVAVTLFWVRPDVEETLRHVEWAVLLFLAALFVTVGGLQASGVLHRLTSANPLLASLVLLWTAAVLSALVDNIPFTIAVIPVILELDGLGIPVAALWWALDLGAGLGSNETPIGATANVITVAQSGGTRTPITRRASGCAPAFR